MSAIFWVRIPVVGAAGLVIGGGAEIHRRGVDHVAVELRQRCRRPARPGPAKARCAGAGRRARCAAIGSVHVDAVGADRRHIARLRSRASAAPAAGGTDTCSARGPAPAGQRQRTGDHAVGHGTAGESIIAAFRRPEGPQPARRRRQAHARALARPAVGQRDRIRPAVAVEPGQVRFPICAAARKAMRL